MTRSRWNLDVIPRKGFEEKANHKRIHTVLDTDNLPFSADMPHRFSADSHVAIDLFS